MAESYRLTRVEELGQKHQRGACAHCDREHTEDLESFVNRRQLKPHRIPFEELSTKVEQEFGERIAPSTLQSHFARRAWRYARDETAELLQEAGADPERESTQVAATLLKGKLFERRAELDDLDYLDLMRESRLLGDLNLKYQQLELDNKALELKVEQAKQKLKETTDEAESKIRSGQQLTVEDINRIRERTFGKAELNEK